LNFKDYIVKKKLFIHTFGCKINQYESQVIREKYILESYIIVDKIELADVIIINSCSVTNHADKQCNQLIKKILLNNPITKIILTGCYAKVSCKQILQEFPDIIIKTKDEMLEGLNQEIKSFDNHSRAFLKIQDGCNSFCSYCIIPYARSKMWSKPVENIIAEINNLIDNGYVEIVLTGIHIGKYDSGISYLLSQIFKNIKKDFRIRLSSIEINEINNDLIKLMKQEPIRLCNHLHIPLQSGSDKILKDMNRKYTSKDFSEKLINLKTYFPDISITTDVICGFPTETLQDFADTYMFLEENEFSRLHVFPYSKRNGTKAFDLTKVYDNGDLKPRVDKLLKLDVILRNNYHLKFIGTKRKAVPLRNRQALTDNYLTIKNVDRQEGIFDVIVG